MPLSEFRRHKWFWNEYRWGMTDDLLAISIATQFKSVSAKSNVHPWQIKHWTVQKDYAWQSSKLVVKPVSAIRNGFMAVYNAIKGMKHG